MDKKYISDNKRVILITGDHSKWFEQAIFIVKKNAAEKCTETDFIREAEMIIHNYMTGVSSRTPRVAETLPIPVKQASASTNKAKTIKKRSKLDVAINAVIIVACVALMLMVSKGLM